MENETDTVPVAGSNAHPGGSTTNDAAEGSCVYHIKWINWMNEKTAIVTQNKNGPCPLLAIFNVLLLSKRINLSSVLEMISSKQMMDYIGTVMLENMPCDLSEADKLNYEQNMSDAIAIFSKLQTGIDVNVQFKHVFSFECTSEMAVFDILRIPLYHGWLPDPQDESTCRVINNCSYNQIIDTIISSKESADEEVVQNGLIAEQYLNSTASQLTCHGVIKILETMSDGQIGVFFRNNHFATLFKKSNELFTLVTDQGFLTKSDIVWETLSSVQGDSHFTDAAFCTTPLENPVNDNNLDLTQEQQLEHDFQVALSLQEDPTPLPSTTVDDDIASQNAKDAQLAARLQQEYDQQAHAAARSSRVQEPAYERRQNDKCTLL